MLINNIDRSRQHFLNNNVIFMSSLINQIREKTWMETLVITNISSLLDQWNTVPFIARYRKEMTKWATDEQLRDFYEIYMYTKNLEARKQDVIRLIDVKGLLTPELKDQILNAETLARVEDLYRPFKEKKNTKATIAKAKWLEPLAKILAKAQLSKEDFEKKAEEFVKDTWDKKTSVWSVEEAIQWAKDIIAEDVSDHADLRADLKEYEEKFAVLETKATKTFEENWVYKIYKEYSKVLADMPSYAYLAVARAEKEKQLSIKMVFSKEKIDKFSKKYFMPENAGSSAEYLQEAIDDWLERLLLPSLERELRADKKRWSDEAAIKVFGENLKQLLLTPPVQWLTVLWFDPAFRTWCKLAVVDKTWKFLEKSVIYPTEPQNKVEEAQQTLLDLVKKYNIDLIVLWNGTASRESEKVVADFIKKNKLKVQYLITSEAWASVYSASELAQQEYPNLDVTIRWAISIAHRVQDPLAELTKIDPKAIWVWQYQHDVDQKFLKEKLNEKVEDIVNSVWVDVNTASYTLLQYIAWLSTSIAKNIVAYRDENWSFTDKKQIKKVKWLWPKAYEQAIGFLRIKWGKEVLDSTWIHPDHYKQVYDFIENELKIKKKDLVLPLKLRSYSEEEIEDFSNNYGLWYETMEDCIKELQRPWLDPREELEKPCFKSDVLDIKDVQVWMKLQWVVRNITDFGAFVDVWLHNDWLVHKSQLADFYVQNPIDVVKVWQQVTVRVLDIDLEKERLSLSMKWEENTVVKENKEKSPKKDRRESSEWFTLWWNITFS